MGRRGVTHRHNYKIGPGMDSEHLQGIRSRSGNPIAYKKNPEQAQRDVRDLLTEMTRQESLLWRIANAKCLYVEFQNEDGSFLYADVSDGLWEEIARVIGYDEMGG